MAAIVEKFSEIAGMPCVTGAIDGTLINIDAPTENEGLFYLLIEVNVKQGDTSYKDLRGGPMTFKFTKLDREQKMASNRDTRKRLFFKYSQEDLQKAIAEHEKGVSMRMAAKKFQIPLGTLFNKVRGLVPNQRRMMGPSTILSVEEEGLIVNWLKASAKKGIPIIKRTLLETVKDIVKQDKRENPFTNDMPDESSFQTCPKTGKVLGPISFDNFYEIKSGNEKEAITVMANFSADGKTVCPMVVYRSACSQMTTLGALFDQPTKDPFLNKDKDIIKNTLPDGWRNWALNECAPPPPFSQAHRNKLRFALPSLEVVRAFTKEDHISERSYKKMLSSLLDWPVGQALILAPSNLSSAYRPSKESYEQFLADTSSLKSLILSRKEINAALENSQDHGRKSLSPETDISSLRIKPIRGNRSCPSIDRAY
ncbi:hypothetical protein M8J75_000924 [Diaphorina citri]|nr:hypothetical protein M8J75_000924 [Diaphorina citri]